jgi:Ca-activated chloride channel family protein
MRERTPGTDSDPKPRGGLRRPHAIWLVGLLTLTLAAGVAARIVRRPPPVDPIRSGVSSAHGGGVTLAASLDRHSVLQGGDGLVRVELRIGAEERDALGLSGGLDGLDAPTTPTDLVVVLDRSGSMQGEPLASAKRAVVELLSQLGERDRFGLVTYATGGEVLVGLEPARGDARQRWDRALSAIRADGGTNMSRGLDLAHELVSRARDAGHAPRVILISDGHANQGDHSIEALRQRAARAVGGEYVISTVGVGQGFDEVMMSGIADSGTGNFYYLPDVRQLAGVFADEFAAARERVARGLEVWLRPEGGVQLLDAAGLPLERDAGGVRFRPGDLFAGQERHVWLTLRAPTGDLGEVPLGELSLRFTDLRGEPRELRLVGLPALACVAGEDDYYAAFDAGVYRRASGSEALGSLKQKVAAFIKDGRQREAVDEVDQYLDQMKLEQTRALGYVISEDAASVAALRAAVAAPEAARPDEQNRLGKTLLEAGRDERRVGSKR